MQGKYYLKAKRIFTENGILENQAVDALEVGGLW